MNLLLSRKGRTAGFGMMLSMQSLLYFIFMLLAMGSNASDSIAMIFTEGF